MTEAPKTNLLREIIIEQYKEDELTGDGMGNILAALAKIETLERERDNALSDAKQADTDSIRALAERNEAREQLAAERALADRLAMTLGTFCGGTSSSSYAAWKEARND